MPNSGTRNMLKEATKPAMKEFAFSFFKVRRRKHKMPLYRRVKLPVNKANAIVFFENNSLSKAAGPLFWARVSKEETANLKT